MKPMTTLFSLFLIVLSLTTHAQHKAQGTIKELNGILAAYRCSGALIDLGQADHQPAIVLTAGHCTAPAPDYFYKPSTATINKSIIADDEFVAYYQQKDAVSPLIMGNFKLNSILYATMTTIDVSLIQSSQTMGQLKAAGLRFFKLANQPPKIGTELSLISGLWGQVQKCSVEKVILDNNQENILFGTNTDPVKMKNSYLLNAHCTGQGGWSGSPLVDLNTGLIYGVASRIYEKSTGSIVIENKDKARIIVSNTIELQKCLTSKGQFYFNTNECHLPYNQ